MRKLVFQRPFQCEILVFDNIGAGWIEYCLPSDRVTSLLSMRDQIPFFLSITFLVRIFKELLFLPRFPFRPISYVLTCALLDQINPKVILTCMDNNRLIARYASERPNIKVIFVQNAIRNRHSLATDIKMPTYLALGTLDASMFSSIGIPCQEYHPIGSVKLGIALSKYSSTCQPSSDLCFISHYRPNLLAMDSTPLFQKIEDNQRMLFHRLASYAAERNFSLTVLSKTREPALQAEEFEYFLDITLKCALV